MGEEEETEITSSEMELLLKPLKGFTLADGITNANIKQELNIFSLENK